MYNISIHIGSLKDAINGTSKGNLQSIVSFIIVHLDIVCISISLIHRGYFSQINVIK